MGTEFIPDHEVSEKHPSLISPDRYNAILAENPELYVHPNHFEGDRCQNMHFKMAGEGAAPG